MNDKKKRVKLELLYDTGSTLVKVFPSRREAETFAYLEGDHVWDYNIKEIE